MSETVEKPMDQPIQLPLEQTEGPAREALLPLVEHGERIVIRLRWRGP